jgi:hypothetical protein
VIGCPFWFIFGQAKMNKLPFLVHFWASKNEQINLGNLPVANNNL